MKRGSGPGHGKLTTTFHTFLLLLFSNHNGRILIIRSMLQKFSISVFRLLHGSTEVISIKISQRNSFSLYLFFFVYPISKLVSRIITCRLIINDIVLLDTKEKAFGLDAFRNSLILFIILISSWITFIPTWVLSEFKRRFPNPDISLGFISLALLLSLHISFLAMISCNRPIRRI